MGLTYMFIASVDMSSTILSYSYKSSLTLVSGRGMAEFAKKLEATSIGAILEVVETIIALLEVVETIIALLEVVETIIALLDVALLPVVIALFGVDIVTMHMLTDLPVAPCI